MKAMAPFLPKRWTRLEYDRLIEIGFFRPEDRIELIGGALVVAEPKGTAHETAVGLVEDAVRSAFGSGFIVRAASPIAPDEESEPEPDVSVASGVRRDYRDAHPIRPVLVVEVAETRLRFDRTRKGSLYARAGIPDYWILNLVDRVLEIYREPARARSTPFGWRYAERRVLQSGDAATRLAAASAAIPVADLLP